MSGIVVFIAIAAVTFVINGIKGGRQRTAWQQAATELGLELRSGKGPGQLVGTLRGLPVTVGVEYRGSGDNRSKWTIFEVRHQIPGPSLRLRKDSIGGRFKRAFGFGGNDLVIGDPAFDEAVAIDSDDPTAVAAFLSPARRMAVLTLFEGYRNAEIGNQRTTAELHGVVGSADDLIGHIRFVTDIAVVVATPGDVDRALTHQDVGDLDRAIEEFHELNEVDEPNEFTQLLELEAHVANDDPVAAREVLGAVEHPPPVVTDWGPVVDALPGGAAAPVAPVTTEPGGPGQQAVLEDLFVSKRMGFETEAHFLETYQGTVVTWRGTVDRVQELRYDSVFDGEGTKVSVEIGEFGDGRFIARAVDAVVRLPHGGDVQRGDVVEFTGVLVKLDRYMRNLYVDHGELLEVVR